MKQSPNTELARFFKSLLLVLPAIIVLDLAIGKGMAYLHSRQQSGLLYRAKSSIDSTTANYLAMGSSRANHHYDPRVFESILGSSFYNCGRDGQKALYSCAVTAAVLKRYDPKCVIIDILPDEFTVSEEGTLSTLLPFYKNSAIRPYLDFNGKFQGVKLMSSIYPYNSLFTNLIVGLRKHHEEDYKGYVALNTLNTDDNMITIGEVKPPETAKINAFYNLLSELDKRNVLTLLVISPVYANNTGSCTPGVCQEAANRFKNVRFLNYTNIRDWQHREDFSDDEFHLNKSGAIKFSGEIAKIIKASVKQ